MSTRKQTKRGPFGMTKYLKWMIGCFLLTTLVCLELKYGMFAQKMFGNHHEEKANKEIQEYPRPTADPNEFKQKRFQDLPWIYVITPTYTRTVQKAELTRLGNTLLHVPNLYWIIIEDSSNKTAVVSNYLARSRMSYTHLNVLSPPRNSSVEPRGPLQRNKGLEWIRANLNPTTDKGVVYFADDDNTYDLKLFEEMRFTNKVSVWPVAFVSALRFESPRVKNGSVTEWFTGYRRLFSIDMAGFAINIKLFFQHPEAKVSLTAPGQLETLLLQSLVTLRDLEPKANNCTQFVPQNKLFFQV